MPSQSPTDYNSPHAPTWCPGCGDFGIWAALKNVLSQRDMEPHNTAIVYGIGCSGNMTNTVNTYGFHSLHGRSIPTAAGIKLANHKLDVLAVVGDGDCYGEGLSHFIHAARANHDVTVIIHDNHIYSLTTGQTSPTSSQGFKSKSTPQGVIEEELYPLVLAISSGASHVSQGFAGDIPHLTSLIKEAVEHKGFSVINIFQPCVTFNKTNTYEWFRERIYKLDAAGHRPDDKIRAIQILLEKERLPIGLLYKSDRPAYHKNVPQLEKETLVERGIQEKDISIILDRYL